MPGSLASINIKFFADLKQFSSEMQNMNRQLKKHGKQMQEVGKGFSTYLTAPLLALTAVSLISYDKQAKAIAQVEAGIKSTGAAAGFTSQQLQTMASDLQNKTIFGDEEILKDATAQLLTFTNIAGEQFARTQVAVLDLATRLDGDLKSASIQLGKALNDPVANLSALSRSGIQFSKEQKSTINALVATNRLAEAQTLILDELQKQYGGSAEAAAKAGLGGMKQLSNIIGDLSEDFGKIISEAIAPFIVKIKEMVLAFKDLPESTKKTIVVVAALAAAIGPLLVVLGFMMTTIIPGLITAFGFLSAAVTWVSGAFVKLTAVMLANPWTAVAVAIAAVVAYFVLFNKETEKSIKQQDILSEVTDTAAKSIAGERAKLTELLAIAKNERIHKESRIKAIKELNNLSPKYLGNLTLETINTNTATEAVRLYNEELMKTARVKAAQEKLTAIAAKQIDAELSHAKQMAISETKRLDRIKELIELGDIESLKLADQMKNTNVLGDIIDTVYDSKIAKLTAESNILTDIIGKNILLNSVVAGNGKGKRSKKVNITTSLAGGDMSQTLTPIKSALSELNGFSGEAINGISSGFIKIPEKLGIALGLSKQQLSLFKTELTAFQMAGVEIGDAVGGAFESLSGRIVDSLGLASTGFGGFVAGMISTITKLIAMMLASAISQSIAGATASGVATGPAAIFTTPAFIATAVGGVLAAFAAIPKFAEGGIMGGSSYYGDKLMAFLNSGEAVITRDHQKTLVGALSGGGQNINVGLNGEFRLNGQDLLLVVERATNRKNRTQ